MASHMMAMNFDAFPVWALLPKKETLAASFVAKYPEYDGRGVKIAIFDSGVDPGASGLQTTTTGEPKVIDMMDGSGAGDVDTSTVVEVDENGYIIGLSGRKLKIPPSWKNESGKYHIGLKNAYELYPRPLRDRMAQSYKNKFWIPSHKKTHAKAYREYQEYVKQVDQKTKNGQENKENKEKGNIENKGDELNMADVRIDPKLEESKAFEEKMQKEELQSRIDLLNNIDKKFVDSGPTYDCIVFHDGSIWRGCIDTSEQGDLEKCKLLGSYRETLEYGTLNPGVDALNYSLNFHHDGDILEIASLCSNHGTHVASIAAAHFPDEPEKNGVAPGAQIISVCIGDNRLGATETGTALIRAFVKVIESGADIINMSYGETSGWAGGRIIEKLNELVDKYGVIKCSSAGNEGPALSTIGTPPVSKTTAMIGIGAYVTPDMMIAEYSMRNKVEPSTYTWSSRGPTIDGDFGVHICAPGGAITSVGNWSLKKAQLMNGTSMSSPNACGCISLLLSGLKAKSITYSPYSIRSGIQNTAYKPHNYDAFSMGHGLIQVEPAFEYLTNFSDSIHRDIRFKISCGRKRGIYLREYQEILKPSIHSITIEPIYLNHDNYDTEKKINFEMHFNMITDASWVNAPRFLSISSSSRGFTVKVDPTNLRFGATQTSIRAFDSKCVEKGPVFSIPITVIKPVTIDPNVGMLTFPELLFNEGGKHVDFILPPPGSTCAIITIRSLEPAEPSSFMLHALQLKQQRSFKAGECKQYFQLKPLEEVVYYVSIEDNRTLEVCLAKWWASIGDTRLSLTIDFRGIKPIDENIVFQSSNTIKRIDFTIADKYEEILPTVTLKKFNVPLKPTDFVLRPLGTRDVIPDEKQVYELVLSYTLQLLKEFNISLFCPLFHDILYESEFESQMWMIFDSNKRAILIGDAFSTKRYSETLEKGEYNIKLQIRHDDSSLLEKYNDIPIIIVHKLPQNLNLDVFSTYQQCMLEGKKFCSRNLAPHSQSVCFLPKIADEKYPKGIACSPGCYFTGDISFTTNESRKKVDNFSFTYLIDCENPKKKIEKKEEEKNVGMQYFESLKELKISWLSKLNYNQEEAQGIIKEFQEELNPEFKRSFIISQIQAIENDKTIKGSDYKKIISLADEILINENIHELMGFLTVAKNDKKGNSNISAKDNHKKLERQKGCLIDALCFKGVAICELMNLGEESLPHSLQDLDNIYQDVSKLTDVYSEAKVANFMEKYLLLRSQYAKLLKLYLKQQETKPSYDLDVKCGDIFEKLDYKHIADYYRRVRLVKFPKSNRLF